MPSTYEYTPLENDGAIRLLDLSPPSPGNPEDLHCRIRSTTLEEAAKTFEALSYTRGRHENVETIKCNDDNALLQISANCYKALLCLRRQDEHRTLWVDAICIHQANDSERSAHVKIMGDIFARARETVVFLGDGEKSREIEKSLSHLSREKPSPPNNQEYTTHDATYADMKIILEHPWFHGVWTVQEVVNSESVVFTCGSHSALLSELRSYIYNHETPPLPPLMDIIINKLREGGSTGDPPDNPTRATSMRLHLLIAHTGLFESTDPRDRILALVPLLKKPFPEIEDIIDYSLSPEDLFWRLAVVFLERGAGLALLWMIRHPRRDNGRGTPSWVPDWADTVNRSLVTPFLPSFYAFYELFDDRTFTLSNASRLGFPRLLTVRGRAYGHIQELGPILSSERHRDPKQSKRAFADLVTELFKVEEPSPGPYSSVKSIATALSEKSMGELLNLLGGRADGRNKVTTEVGSNLNVTCLNASLFATESGKLGLCPKEAQQGDLVCLIEGAPAACILRHKYEHQYTIISGDCILLEIESKFTEGGGDGYIWEYIDESELPSESMREFTIC